MFDFYCSLKLSFYSDLGSAVNLYSKDKKEEINGSGQYLVSE